MGSNYSMKYSVDIVMCIDATGSMGHIINTVKEHALNFYSDVKAEMEKKTKHVDELRVRVIAFRDYLADGENAMLATDFYSLPDEAVDFKELVSSINAEGGGDDPEDGLEALAYAMSTKWSNGENKPRHIIVLWSDDAAHELGFGREAPNYPKKMAKNFEELTEWWGDEVQPGRMNQYAKRLVIYAPDKGYWRTIAETWDNVVHFPSEAGNGLQNLEYEEILSAIVNSI